MNGSDHVISQTPYFARTRCPFPIVTRRIGCDSSKSSVVRFSSPSGLRCLDRPPSRPTNPLPPRPADNIPSRMVASPGAVSCPACGLLRPKGLCAVIPWPSAAGSRERYISGHAPWCRGSRDAEWYVVLPTLERVIGAVVLKTGVPERVPGVRIPLHPLSRAVQHCAKSRQDQGLLLNAGATPAPPHSTGLHGLPCNLRPVVVAL